MNTYPQNKEIFAYLEDLNNAAIAAGQFWAVAKRGKNTKRIIGKYATREQAEQRAEKYRGRCHKVYVCGVRVAELREIPTF